MKQIIAIIAVLGLTACATNGPAVQETKNGSTHLRFTKAIQLYLGNGENQNISEADRMFDALAKSDPSLTTKIADFFLNETTDFPRAKKWLIRWHDQIVASLNPVRMNPVQDCISESDHTTEVKGLANGLVQLSLGSLISPTDLEVDFLKNTPQDRGVARQLASGCLGKVT